MNLLENIRLAWEGVKSNKMRSLLTMLGIIIGIGSVIAILTVSDGLSGTMNSSMSSLGATNITVALQERESDYMGMGMMFSTGNVDEEDLITDEMLDALRERYPEAVAGISITQNVGSGQIKAGHDYANISLSGINEDFLDTNNIKMMRGRNFAEEDLEGYRNTAIVSNKLVNNLFNGDINAAMGQEVVAYVGKEIYTFNIIGVYEYEQTMMNFSLASEKDLSTALYIPLDTAQKLANAKDGYDYVTVKASGAVDSAAFAKQAEDFINRYYANNDDYHVSAISMETMLDTMNTMLDTLSIAIAVIAGISLLVGGIGVMNIMLVSVTERTREIGTRKAIGATNSNIRIQFVVESAIICLIGGILGIIFGGALGYFGSSLLGMPSMPTLFGIVLAVGFSMIIGIFFGYYPANKAAKLDPIEALRYE